MARDIRINEPGAGEWIARQLGTHFTPGWDNSFSSHDGDRILGGFIATHFLGGSMTCHMASQDKRWCSKDLLWLLFHYGFEQLGVHKMLTTLPSNQYDVIAMDMRAGWGLEAVVRDAYAPGVHMMILGMTRDTCPWLKYEPRIWVPRNAKAA
jgi:hypothetical protein